MRSLAGLPAFPSRSPGADSSTRRHPARGFLTHVWHGRQQPVVAVRRGQPGDQQQAQCTYGELERDQVYRWRLSFVQGRSSLGPGRIECRGFGINRPKSRQNPYGPARSWGPPRRQNLTHGPTFARLRVTASSAETAELESSAEVAELADARGSGPRTRKGVGVRVPSSAP